RVPGRVGTHHGFILGSSRWMSRLHGRLTNSRVCSVMVAVSAQVREHAIRVEKAKDSKLVVIQNGIEPLAQTVGTIMDRETIREQLGVSANGLLLLTVGRLTVQKGHTVLLDVIAQIASRYPRALFAFAGDGPQRSHLVAQAARLGISDRVLFLGVRTDVANLLQAADIFVQPSLSEGLSIALLEALFAGLPVVATRAGGVVDVVENGESALLVPTGDVQALATALGQVLDDASLRKRLAHTGQARAQANYSIEKMCKAYENLMKGLLLGT
ncbi:MAG TPA: glycosyltransferase family 4 protein, partial [Anaerolineales bacterium]